ncbi:MAG: hypothetical protein Q4F05_19415 [bacterium]|nr:hypothetical protein [bacterium]
MLTVLCYSITINPIVVSANANEQTELLHTLSEEQENGIVETIETDEIVVAYRACKKDSEKIEMDLIKSNAKIYYYMGSTQFEILSKDMTDRGDYAQLKFSMNRAGTPYAKK